MTSYAPVASCRPEAELDFESDKKSYTVVVTATDPSGALDTIAW